MISTEAPKIIAGYARSGTTWIQDVLANANGLRTVFEPLHPDVIRGAELFSNRYVGVDDVDQELRRHLQLFLNSKHSAVWSDYRIRWDWLIPKLDDFLSLKKLHLIARRFRLAARHYRKYRKQKHFNGRLCKLIRANMMLSWIRRNFDARIVFIIRHPAAVVISQMRNPEVWDAHWCIDRYRKDTKLLDHIDEESKSLLFSTLTDVQALTLSWCIENTIAIQQASTSGAYIVCYEELIHGGQTHWQAILDALDLEQMPAENAISVPSQQAWGDRLKNPELVGKPAKWMSHIDRNTSDDIRRVLDVTGNSLYSMQQALPLSNFYVDR